MTSLTHSTEIVDATTLLLQLDFSSYLQKCPHVYNNMKIWSMKFVKTKNLTQWLNESMSWFKDKSSKKKKEKKRKRKEDLCDESHKRIPTL